MSLTYLRGHHVDGLEKHVDAPHEEIVDAEIVPTESEARQSIERAKGFLNGFWDEVLWQVRNKVWESIDEYEDFNALWDSEYAHLGVSITRSQRPELVSALRSIGQTKQEIHEKTGASRVTIDRDLNVQNVHSPATITNSRGQERPATYNKRVKDEWPEVPPAEEVKEMNATPEHHSPFDIGEPLVLTGNGSASAFVGDDGRATSNSSKMLEALEWARAHPDQSRSEAAERSGLSVGTVANAYTALRNNGELIRPNRLVERFDSIAQGLTYIADDLAKQMDDLRRADADELEYGREFFEDAMTKLNSFRRELNKKFK